MILNLAPKIISDIILCDIDIFIRDHFPSSDVSISPLMIYENEFYNNDLKIDIKFKAGQRDTVIKVYTINFSDGLFDSLLIFLREKKYDIAAINNILCKKNFIVAIEKDESVNSEKDEADNQDIKRIDLSFSSDNVFYSISLVIESDYFRHLIKKREIQKDTELLEEDILNFFSNPENVFPNLKIVLDSLKDFEFQKLLYKLQKKKLLTTYQLCLLVRSFPEHSLRVKKNISANNINDVIDMLDKLSNKKGLSKRDLIEGIYSIEEAIYMLMKDDEDMSFSRFLSNTYAYLKKLVIIKKIITRDFSEWVREISDSGLLYQTISALKEEEFARAISDRPDYYIETIKEKISKRKTDAVREFLQKGEVSFTDRIEARYFFLLSYRKLKIKRLDPGAEKFNILISRIKGDNAMVRLLFGVGWFVLATAFKTGKPIGLNEKKKILSLLEGAPVGAKYLIIDVLSGTVNPNIIHDEMQINRARELCVREIASMYEDGIISLF